MKNDVASIVDSIRKKYNVSNLPVDLTKLASDTDVKIKYGTFEDQTSGFAYQKGGTKYIGVNVTESVVRQRFTIAHEFGHIFMHHKDALKYDASLGVVHFRDEHSATGEDLKEREANAFAAELLMPAEILKKEIQNMKGIDLHDPIVMNRLADKFGVSQAALTVRLVSLYGI